MRKITISIAVFVTSLLTVAGGARCAGQDSANTHWRQSSDPAPLYRISFKPGDPVPGIGAMPAIRLPFECTGDGTVYITMVQALGTGPKPANLSPYSPSLLLTSVSLSHEAHSFPLDQVPDLYDLHEIGDYVSESKVVFLVRATRENKQTPQSVAAADGTKSEAPRNITEHHFYIIMFDRDGSYQKTIEIDAGFHLNQLALFSTGNFLAQGYEEADHIPKLAMLKDDGTLLKWIEFPKGDAPESALGTKDASGKGAAVYIAPVQFIGQGHFIYLVQNKTKFPLLEINEAGAVREIKPHLPEGVQINMLVPSDENLYARMNEIQDGSIYELNLQDGAILRRFQVENNGSSADVACIHDGKFLSFEHGEGKLVPLVGTAEPSADAVSPDQPKRNTAPSPSSKANSQ